MRLVVPVEVVTAFGAEADPFSVEEKRVALIAGKVRAHGSGLCECEVSAESADMAGLTVP